MDKHDLSDPVISLEYARPINGVLQTGLTVTVTVTNASTNATLLAATAMPEIASGAGIYKYVWTHGLTQDTQVLVTYSVGGTRKVQEFIQFTTATTGGGAV